MLTLNGEKIQTTRDLERIAGQRPYLWKLTINRGGQVITQRDRRLIPASAGTICPRSLYRWTRAAASGNIGGASRKIGSANARRPPMTFPLNLLSLCGAVALLLWGSHMVQTGIQRAFGPRLRSFLAGALQGRFQAFFAGIGGLPRQCPRRRQFPQPVQPRGRRRVFPDSALLRPAVAAPAAASRRSGRPGEAALSGRGRSRDADRRLGRRGARGAAADRSGSGDDRRDAKRRSRKRTGARRSRPGVATIRSTGWPARSRPISCLSTPTP